MTKRIKIAVIGWFFLMPLLFIFAHLASADAPQLQQLENQQTTTTTSSSLKDNPIVKDINTIVNFLSIGVGVVVIAMVILGGVQYSMAGANPEAINKAKQRIINAAIALGAYLLIFSFLQWLIPGGLFNQS